MRSPRKTVLPAVLLGFCLTLASLTIPGTAARAEDPAPNGPPDNSPGELAREGLGQMMRALRLLVESIPQYELPEVLENGDVIIRRKHDGDKPAAEPEIDETAT
ncbi:MAG: hypothetical protein ACFB13_17645 [Kiloniellaceae bacterium]